MQYFEVRDGMFRFTAHALSVWNRLVAAAAPGAEVLGVLPWVSFRGRTLAVKLCHFSAPSIWVYPGFRLCAISVTGGPGVWPESWYPVCGVPGGLTLPEVQEILQIVDAQLCKQYGYGKKETGMSEPKTVTQLDDVPQTMFTARVIEAIEASMAEVGTKATKTGKAAAVEVVAAVKTALEAGSSGRIRMEVGPTVADMNRMQALLATFKGSASATVQITPAQLAEIRAWPESMFKSFYCTISLSQAEPT